LRVLVEEVGEVAKAQQDETDAELRAELIQVAAVAVAMVEALDRGDVPRS
jgi:NTP pyrophosphatase (non-canonical NTP hydrolase)